MIRCMLKHHLFFLEKTTELSHLCNNSSLWTSSLTEFVVYISQVILIHFQQSLSFCLIRGSWHKNISCSACFFCCETCVRAQLVASTRFSIHWGPIWLISLVVFIFTNMSFASMSHGFHSYIELLLFHFCFSSYNYLSLYGSWLEK